MGLSSPDGLELECGDCPIRHRAVCARCDREELDRLEEMKHYRSFDAGQRVIGRAEEMNFVGSVVSGVATLSQTMEDGRRQMVGLLMPSDFLGRPGRTEAAYDVVAATDLVLCCFRRKPFEELVAEVPNISRRLLEMTLDELEAAREWMFVLGRKTARERIASLLTALARRDLSLARRASGRAIEFELPLTREAMSDYLGLTLETASRQMSSLKRDGVIALTGTRRVVVHDFDRLLVEAGERSDDGPLSRRAL